MRTISRVIGSAGALSVLMLSAASVFGQTYHQHEFTQCILRGGPVLDAPLSAEATTVWHPPPSSGRGEIRATAHYYRDRAGRVRVEQNVVGDDRPSRISRADQRAELFEVPSDYETGPVKYPLSWHSPKTELRTQGRQRR
jgi:hypothetical protein